MYIYMYVCIYEGGCWWGCIFLENIEKYCVFTVFYALHEAGNVVKQRFFLYLLYLISDMRFVH